MRAHCTCDFPLHVPRSVVLTGGPGAGKTAVLEVVQRHFCDHVVVLPEAARILFHGGFPRSSSGARLRAAQRAIYAIQVELERAALDEAKAAVVICDRGTIDCLAYWDGTPESFWADVHSTPEQELARYAAVIHLRTPPAERSLERGNPGRFAAAAEATRIDERLVQAWSGHPQRTVIASDASFLSKLTQAVEAVRREVPLCCRAERVDVVKHAS